MAYDITNPPALVHQMVGKNGGSTWVYDSKDAAAVVGVDGYITNARDLGMKHGDVIHQRDTNGGVPGVPVIAHDYVVVGIDPVTGAGDLSDGTATPAITNAV